MLKCTAVRAVVVTVYRQDAKCTAVRAVVVTVYRQDAKCTAVRAVVVKGIVKVGTQEVTLKRTLDTGSTLQECHVKNEYNHLLA
jgi:hypothetical protein